MGTRTVIRTLGHLALWPVFYTIGVLLLTMDLLTDLPLDWRGSLFVGFCAHGCYLLDRVKIADSRLDPADARAQPNRYRLITSRTKGLRSLVILDLLIATALALLIWKPLIPVPIIGAVCVHLYAGRPACRQHPRLKDLPAIKGMMIAGAHTALAVATLIGITGSAHMLGEPAAVISLLIVAATVFADAVLCDLDDHDADRAYATKSMPVLIGPSPAWTLAFLTHLAAGIAFVTHDRASPGSIAFAVGIVATDVLLTRMKQQRDWVDARLLPLAWLLVAFR